MVARIVKHGSYSPYVCIDVVATGIYEPALYRVSVTFVKVYADSVTVCEFEYVAVAMTI